MKKKIFSILLTLVLVLTLGLVMAVPASAADGAELELTYDSGQNDINKNAGHPYIEWTIDGPCIEFTFVNPTPHTFVFDYRVDGEEGETWDLSEETIKPGIGECSGQLWGLKYNWVVIAGVGTETVQVRAEEEVWVGMRVGGEQDWYLDWIVFELPSAAADVVVDVVQQTISIEISPPLVDFGSIIQGGTGSASLNVINRGNVAALVTAELIDEVPEGFYTANFRMDGKLVVNWGVNLSPAEALTDSQSVELTLEIPLDAGPGTKTATIIFWAEDAS